MDNGTMALPKKERLILELLASEGPLYGLQLVDHSDGALKRGTVYVTLGRMEAKGLVESQQEPRELYRVGLASVPFLMAIGDLLIGWLLLEHAEIALDALDERAPDRDRAFYEGKVGVAEFFARHILPRLSSDRAVIESIQLGAMDLPEDAF